MSYFGNACLTGALSIAVASLAQAAVISSFGFEGTTTPADLNNSTVGPAVANDGGAVAGTFGGVHASSATDWSTPSGPTSANSYSVNTWAVGDYFQASTSTLDYSDISVSFDATGSNTGPRDFTLAYSTDGVSFTNFTTYTLVNASWSALETYVNPANAHFDFDLSAVTALDEAATVYFRLIDSSTTAINSVNPVAAGGTSRVDNFTISGTPVPEPATLAVLGLAGLATLRRRRQA